MNGSIGSHYLIRATAKEALLANFHSCPCLRLVNALEHNMFSIKALGVDGNDCTGSCKKGQDNESKERPKVGLRQS